MTEYDFSPEAYQAHLANMHRISKWVDRTEDHRPEFVDAAALTERPNKLWRGDDPFSGRRRAPPPPLHLPPMGAMPYDDPAYGMGASPYPSPLHSSNSYDMGFTYANGPGSPGPMPSSMDMHGHSHHPHYGPMLLSPPPSPPHHRHGHSHHSRRHHSSSHSSFVLPPGPTSFFPPMGMSGQPMYAPAPGYVILPPSHSRHRGHHRSGPSVSYVYV